MAKIAVHLSKDELQELMRLVNTGHHPARMIRRAQILLRSDDGWTDEAVGAALGVSRQTVYDVSKQAVSEGVDASLRHTSGRRPGQQPTALDGVAEALSWLLRSSASASVRWLDIMLRSGSASQQTVAEISTDVRCSQHAGNYLQANGIDVYYKEYGSGEHLLLLHSGGGVG